MTHYKINLKQKIESGKSLIFDFDNLKVFDAETHEVIGELKEQPYTFRIVESNPDGTPKPIDEKVDPNSVDSLNVDFLKFDKR